MIHLAPSTSWAAGGFPGQENVLRQSRVTVRVTETPLRRRRRFMVECQLPWWARRCLRTGHGVVVAGYPDLDAQWAAPLGVATPIVEEVVTCHDCEATETRVPVGHRPWGARPAVGFAPCPGCDGTGRLWLRRDGLLECGRCGAPAFTVEEWTRVVGVVL